MHTDVFVAHTDTAEQSSEQNDKKSLQTLQINNTSYVFY